MPTEAKDIFEATSRSFRELMSENGLGLYIPAYQRPYGWDKDKVAKLIDDTLHGLVRLMESDDSYTFLGTIITIHDTEYSTVHPIVRDEVPAKVLTVIDGQQRLCSLILLAVCLHNQIKLRHKKIFGRKNPEIGPVEEWLNGHTLHILKTLAGTVYEQQAYGDSPIYPRIIRAFDDQWSRKTAYASYNSPIAHLVAEYSRQAEGEKVIDFRPAQRVEAGEGEAALVKRYGEIRATLNGLAKNKQSESLESLPPLADIANNKSFQRALLNHDFPSEVADAIRSPSSGEFAELIRLLVLGAYVLNRIALTVVKGKNEDYAFTIFESLNTTGEPLTAFETFKPRVVSAEGLGDYETSPSRPHVDEVANYLANFRVGSPLQNATRDLLVSFALAETGHKLPKRLADQRTYLKEEYDRYAHDPDERLAFVQHLRETSDFVQYAWDRGKDDIPSFAGLPPDATSDTMKLCIAFLRKLNHSVVIAPIVRFYSTALRADAELQPQEIANLESAIRAMTAFSVLWRASRRTTDNIDRVYRNIMTGIDCAYMKPLARKLKKGRSDGEPAVDVVALRQELSAKLADPKTGRIASRDEWIAQASSIPMYQVSATLARFILLAAYHDTVEDENVAGLVRPGKSQSSPCFSFEGWRNEDHLTVEHVVPQDGKEGWSSEFYEDRETVDRIGNLVLLPAAANSSAGNRPWKEKRILYAALGARSKEDARAIFTEAAATGIEFTGKIETYVELSRYMPHLVALGQKENEWDRDFLDQRSKCLLELAWRRLRPWLGEGE